jgi:hypothetical protein
VGDAAALVVVRIAAGLWPPDSAAGAVSVVSSVSLVELDAVVGAVEDVVLAASEDAPLEEPDDAPDDALEEPDDAPLDESCELAELSRIDASTDELAAEEESIDADSERLDEASDSLTDCESAREVDP